MAKRQQKRYTSPYEHPGSFAPKGKTPIVRQPARRFHSSLISAINNQGKMQWMALKEALNADLLIRFLKQIKHRKRKLDCRQPQGPPRQTRKRVARRAQRTHRSVLSARLQPGTQS